MKQKYFSTFISLVLLNILTANSQITESLQPITFAQAISFAIQNSSDLKIKELNYLIAIEKLNESRLSLVPQVYGRSDIQRNFKIPSTLVPIGKFNATLPPDEVVPIRFGTNWSSGMALVASVKIFDPQIIGDIREKRASLLLDDIERKISRIDIEIETGKAYANCVLSNEQLRFSEDDTINSFRELSESESKYKAGFLKLTDYNQAILNHRSSVSRYKQSYKILVDSKRMLLYWMGMENEPDGKLTLTDTLEILIDHLSRETIDNLDVNSSLTLNRITILNNIEKVRLKNAKAGFMPVISLNGLYGNDFYNNKLILGDKNFWFGNSNVNLSLRIPITEGIGRTKKITQQKYLIDVNNEEMTAARKKKDVEKNKTMRDIEFYRYEADIKRSSLDLAKTNYLAAFSQFTLGRILLSDLLQAELSYKQVKIDYLNALYSYIDSLLELKRIMLS